MTVSSIVQGARALPMLLSAEQRYPLRTAFSDQPSASRSFHSRIRYSGEHSHRQLPCPHSGEFGHSVLAGLGVPARGSSAANLTTRYIPSHTPSLETDSVGKSHRVPTPGPNTVVASHSCSCR